MKKEYIKPEIEVIKVENPNLLCSSSNRRPPHHGGHHDDKWHDWNKEPWRD